MKRTFLINSITSFKGWETCFRAIMAKSNSFRIIFQVQDATSDEEGLNAGKQEFLSLPSVTTSRYEGMADSIEATGDLDNAAQELFLDFMAPAFQGYVPRLWSFQFLQGNEAMLRVDDFTMALLFLEESERAALLAQGVDGLNELEIESFSTAVNPPDIEVLPWGKDDSSSLADAFQKAFSEQRANPLPSPQAQENADEE